MDGCGEQVASARGMVFDIQRYSVHDGPGIRTIVFLKGCPLRCLWCCNPESQSPRPEVMVRGERCIGCGRCQEACARKAIGMGDDGWKVVDHQTCDRCGACVDVCWAGALTLVGRWMTVDEVLDKVAADGAFYQNSGGGVTLSGGEPTAQADFAATLLRACREKGFHTAVETSGFAAWSMLRTVVEVADLVLYDLKVVDARKHVELTGVRNDVILENAKRLAQQGTRMVARLPLVPGLNTAEEDLVAMGRFIRETGGFREVHVLPYHRLGQSKYRSLGRQYGLAGLEPPAREQIEVWRRILEQTTGLTVRVGG